jgi:hypothetical protein
MAGHGSAIHLPSCPRLSRASTSWRSSVRKDVDGRVKPGHDDGESIGTARSRHCAEPSPSLRGAPATKQSSLHLPRVRSGLLRGASVVTARSADLGARNDDGRVSAPNSPVIALNRHRHCEACQRRSNPVLTCRKSDLDCFASLAMTKESVSEQPCVAWMERSVVRVPTRPHPGCRGAPSGLRLQRTSITPARRGSRAASAARG